ncbi:hypothetical protein ES705_34142 [subsurface metagenome]
MICRLSLSVYSSGPGVGFAVKTFMVFSPKFRLQVPSITGSVVDIDPRLPVQFLVVCGMPFTSHTISIAVTVFNPQLVIVAVISLSPETYWPIEELISSTRSSVPGENIVHEAPMSALEASGSKGEAGSPASMAVDNS